uniref:C2H2-type domain-containing protein n=1 Tax=Scleropages formosus TaxID=113540 RepID=A0A8C9WBQ0_SCLFO
MEHTPEEGVVIERKEEITFLKEPVLDSNTGDAQGDVMVGQVVPFVRKEIPPKKDRMDPLKIDMSKPISMPHTSAQLSLQCLECHIIFSDHKSRERHLKHSHPAEYEQCMLGDALFACYVCDRHFTCSRELMAHQRTHTEKQPFKCPICGDAFSRSSELTHHKKVHFGKHGYTCADCGKPCKTLTLLKYHQRTHTGERPYVCKDCGRRFSMSKALQKHRFLHNYDTKVVEETIFLSSATSTAHTTKLTGPEVAFSCCLCGVAFKSAKTMLQHMKHKHSQQREAELNNTVSAGEQLKDGEIMKSQTETCEPIQVLGNMDTFEQGQGLQVIETLGQEQMQQLIETLGQEQTVEHVAIVVQEQLEEQHEDACEQKQPTELELTQKDIATVEEQQVHFGTIELTQAQGQIKNIDMEQAHLHMDTLELELTQDHIETIVLTPVEGHEEAFLLDQTNEQTQRVETAQSPSEEDKAEQANGQVQTEELQHTDGQVGVQLELTQEQVHSGELEQRQPETVQLEQIQGEMEMVELKQIQILEQTETQVIEQGKTQKPMGEGQEENTACDRLEDIQDLSEKTKELQEKTSAQQEKIDECLFQINGTEQEEINHSEHSQNNVLHTHNLEVLAMPTESKDTEESSQISSHAIPLQEIIDESLQVQPKEAQLINEPVKNPQYLKPVEAFPEHTVKEKEQIKHAKKQRKVKQRKPTQTKKGQLVGQFIPPEKQSHSKQDPLQTCKMQKKSVSQCHKQKQKPSTQMTVDKLELKQKSGKEKAKKQDKKVKSHPLLQEKMQQAVPRSSKQMQGVQPRKKLKQIQKAVCQKQSKPKKGQDQVLLKDTQKNRKRGQISEVQFRNQEKFVAEKKLKKQDEANEQKNTNSISLLKDLEQIKQQSLLLLKGHKQPQLKVHKLDPKKTQGMLPVQKQKRTKTQEPQQNMPIQKRRRQTRNSKGRHKDIRKSHPSNSSLVSSTPPAKSKPPRKRKAPSAGVSEIVHARRALSCEECEERFSDRVALEDLNENEVGKISVATDWDMEVEMGEIGLGERVERVSFPALNPSPSLASTFLEGEGQGGGEDNRGVNGDRNVIVVPLDSSILDTSKITTCPLLLHTSSKSFQVKENQNNTNLPNLSLVTEEEIKEELLSEVNLVTVGDDSMENHLHLSEENQEISLNISETALNSNTNMVSSTTETEVKQEEDEIEVEKKENVRRRALRGRGRRRGTNILQRGGGQMQKVREDLKELEKEKDGCHIVLEVQPLTSCDEEEPKICASLSRSCLPTSLEESSDEQLVFELDSVTTSVEVLKTEEGMDGERVEDEGTREKNCQSPCILLERFLTRRERPEEDVDQCQDEMNNEKNVSFFFFFFFNNLCYGLVNSVKNFLDDLIMQPFSKLLELADFLLQNSEAEDSEGNSDSEPEEEACVLARYNEGRRGLANSDKSSRSDQDFNRMYVKAKYVNFEESKGEKTPIDYFTSYLDWDTWEEIASCNTAWSESPIPVTAKEMAQFVGIHIAMGTLKFPDLKLYWQDLTRVPLIADTMPASRFFQLAGKVRLGLGDVVLVRNSDVHNPSPYHSSRQNTTPSSVIHDSNLANTDPLWRVRALLERVRAGCLALTREGNFGVDEYPIHLGRPIRRKSANNARPTLNCAVLVGAGGLILDFNLNVGDSNKEDMIEKMVPRSKKRGEGAVFLCKEELSTPAVLEHLLSAGVKSAARVGGVRGGIGDEFVSSDGKLTLFRCQQGFILSNFSKKQSCPFTIVEDFEGTQKVARLTREMLSLYRTPLSASSAACWPQTVLWHLIDMALVNSWLQYRIDHHHLREPMKLMTFRLEVSKALILSNYSNTPNSSPPPPPLAPQLTSQDSTVSPSPTAHATAPSPDATSRYDGFGHWPEQLSEGEGGRCRFGGCDRTSRVRCLKCCVFLCISQSNNCFLKFHCKGSV